jgi:hypothetical protein
MAVLAVRVVKWTTRYTAILQRRRAYSQPSQKGGLEIK